MNDEIKEMIDNLEDAGFMYKRISPEEIKTLLDYITNLQQENERIEKEYKNKVDEIGKLISRIYKAIEYIQNENNITKHGIYPNYTYEVDTKDLLNILQNGSDNE